MVISPPTATFRYPHLALDPHKLTALVKSERQVGTRYGLGAKINPLSLQATDSAWPGKVDCSGEFHWLTYHALGQPADFDIPHTTEGEPDGSVNQHAWLIRNHFKQSTLDAALGSDEYIRVGVIGPGDTEEGIGHIFMVYKRVTLESCGSHGPCFRDLALNSILHNAHFFVLAPPFNR